MGHRDMDMIIKVYGKYIEAVNGSKLRVNPLPLGGRFIIPN